MTSWTEVEVMSAELVDMIKLSPNSSPDMIIAVARGGFIPARLLASGLKVGMMSSIGIKYANAERENPVLYSTPSGVFYGMRVLLVEDVVETANSMKAANNWLVQIGAVVQSVAYYYLAAAALVPTFSLGVVTTTPSFPWE